MIKEQIKKGLDKAYKEAGHNAYFGNGFEAGVKFAFSVEAQKPVQCKNCKHFEEDENYKGEGKCNNDGRYTREHRVCNLLDTNEKRRNAKIRRK